MTKVLIPLAIGALIIGTAFLTGGASLVAVGTVGAFGAGAELGVATITLGTALATTALGSTLLLAGAAAILSGVSAGLQGAPKISTAQLSRLTPSLVPATPRKIVFGHTAMALDTRYIEPSGTDQEYFDYIIAAASHAVDGIEAIWFEDRIAWTLAGGVDAFYAGYLTVDVRPEGTAANAITINGGARWSSSCRLTGCAYVHLRIRRSGINSKASSPLASGLPGRVTIIGTGAKVYDPRRDSTVGGSGTHRATDQTTWQYTATDGTILGTNPALQALWYKLGWRIGGKLAVGKGMPPARIDLGSYIPAANLCDEAVTLAAGGTQRRYETHGIFSEADSNVLDTICTACAAGLTDTNGRLGIEISHNDLGGAIPAFDDSDVLSAFAYDPCPSLHQSINAVHGRWTDPSAISLYQLADVPEVRIASPDGIDRPATVELGMVQDVNRAQRLFKQFLQRAQFQGVFTAELGIRALGVKRGSVLTLTFGPLGFTNKLFRVMSQTIIQASGRVSVVLREEDPQIYAWDRNETAVVVPSPPILFDPRNNPLAIKSTADLGIGDVQTFLIVAAGYLATGFPRNPGLYKADGTAIAGYGSGYNVCTYAGGVWTGPTTFFPLQAASNATAMANFLNGIADGTPVIIYTYDEPQGNRLTNGLPAAMYRCGASPGRFGSSDMVSRDAYALVGTAGIGSGNGNEFLKGITQSWFQVSATMIGGVLQTAGSAGTIGTPGSPGTAGTPGSNGSPGAPGAAGTPGAPGANATTAPTPAPINSASNGVLVAAGGVLSFDAQATWPAPTGSATSTIKIQYALYGTTSWVDTGISATGDPLLPSEPGGASCAGSWTNPTGIKQLFQFQAVAVGSGPTSPSQSYLHFS